MLIWGAAGGLGVFATQICAAAGAKSVGVVSSDREGRAGHEARRDGLHQPQRVQRHDAHAATRRPDEEKARFGESRRFSKARCARSSATRPTSSSSTSARRPSPTSVFTVKTFGKVVICAGTTGYNLDFDVRYLWMRQKEILGSHFANAYECMKANELIESGQIRPVLWRTMGFDGVAEAHQLMLDNKHLGKIAILVGAERERPGQDRRRPGRDLRGGGCLMAGRRAHPLVRDGLPPRQARARRWREIAPSRCATARPATRSTATATTATSSSRSPTFEDKGDFETLLVRPRVHRLPRRLLELVPGAGRLRMGRPHHPRARSTATATRRRRRAGARARRRPSLTATIRPGPRLPGRRSISIRRRSIDSRMIREICICETPTRLEISVCVRSSSKRSRSTSRSRAAQDVERVVDQHAHLGAAELRVVVAERVGERRVALARRLVERARVAARRPTEASSAPPRPARRPRPRAPARSASGRARRSARRASRPASSWSSCIPRGTCIAHVRSRKWRLSSPSTVGVA